MEAQQVSEVGHDVAGEGQKQQETKQESFIQTTCVYAGPCSSRVYWCCYWK